MFKLKLMWHSKVVILTTNLFILLDVLFLKYGRYRPLQYLCDI